MNRIGILSGGGKLPILIGKSLIKQDYDVVFFCIKGFCEIELYKGFNFDEISINSINNILNKLKENQINKIIMAGHIKRPSIRDIKFDLNSLKIIKDYALDSKGDDKLLSSISKLFAEKGFPFLDWKKECDDLFVKDEFLTTKKPSRESITNKIKGLEVFELIGKADICQSLVIQNNIVLGIEAAEGTDELLKRCFDYKKKGDKGILLKLAKYNQNSNLDIPVIGLDTIKNLKLYDYDGVFLERNKCIILEKEKVISFANSNNIFISSVIKN